jgi:hypothetical protein
VKILLNAFCCLLLLLGSSAHAAKALTRSDYGQLFLATFSYMTVIKACNLSSLYQASDDALLALIRYGYKNGLHSIETERVSQNVSLYTMHGIEEYKKTGKVACADAAKTMRTIINSVKQLK